MVDKIPEPILLKIFHSLSLKELGNVASVSAQWRRIAYDPSLWRETNLGGMQLCEEGAKRLIARIAAVVRKLNLSGCTIPASLIWDISRQCKQLKTLCLQGCHLTKSSTVVAFPYPCFEKLENLDLRFLYGDDLKIFTRVLPQLTNIQSLGVDNMSSANDLVTMLHSLGNLRIFHCQNCASFTDSHVEMLGDYCPKLESLCLTGCIYVTGSAFPQLIRDCRDIKTLLLSCTRLRNEHILRTDWRRSGLTELDISYCYGISETGLKAMLPQLTELRYLQISFCGWGRALNNNVIRAMTQAEYKNLKTFDIHSSFNISGDILCSFLSQCPSITTLCVGSAINTDEELEALLMNLPNLKNFYITKQSTIKTETVFHYITKLCQHIEVLALYNFYAISRVQVEDSLIELVKTCRHMKTLCIRGTNVPLRTELASLAAKAKHAANRNDIDVVRRPHFFLSGASLCLDNVTKFSKKAT